DQALEGDLALADAHLTELAEMKSAVPLTWQAQTDKGRPIPLFVPIPGAGTFPTDQETRHVEQLRLERKLIQTGPADSSYNCHGWVFTGGRYRLRGSAVDLILEDNGYQVTPAPVQGDLAVFRNPDGEVTHTGVTCGRTGGEVLIESKWALM